MKYAFCLLASALAVLCGCGPAARPPATSGQVVRVPLSYWPGTFWCDLAKAKGWFAEAGLRVEFTDTNPDYIASLKAVADGKLDFQNFTLFDLMDYVNRGHDLVMVINSDYSAGADGLVARPGLARLRDLKGQKIGVPKGTYVEYLVHVLLDRHGLRHEDVTLVDVQGEKTPEALASRRVDAVCTWEPFLSEAQKSAQGARLWDTAAIPGIESCGVVFRREFIQQRPNDVQALARVWHRATESIKQQPDEAFGIIAGIYQKTPAEVRAFAATDKILGLRDNELAFSFAAGFDSLHGAARQIGDYMSENGLTRKKLDSTRFLDATFIRNLK